MKFPATILLLEDTPSDAELIGYRLRKAGAERVVWVDDLAEFEREVQGDVDLVISDFNLRGFYGTDALSICRKHRPYMPFVFCSGIVGDERAAELIRSGADDFVAKDNIRDRLVLSVERSYENAKLRKSEFEARQSLHLSTLRLTSIVNNIEEALLLLERPIEQDPESDEIIIKKINPSFIELLAQFSQRVPKLADNPELEIAETLRDVLQLREDKTLLLLAAVQECLNNGGNKRMRENIQLEDGRRYVLDFRITQVENPTSNNPQCLLVIRDITLQVKTEEFILSGIIQAQEKERMRMANELHDGIGQYLSASVLNLNVFKDDEQQISEGGRNKLTEAINNINKAIQEARTIAHALVPKSIEDFGLEAAIGSMLDSISQVGNLEVAFNSNVGSDRFTPEIEINLFRVCQECINNILKHSKATHVGVQILKYEDALILTVEDNGVGFEASSVARKPKGIGINSMRNRVRSIGGECEVSSSPSRGTHILIEIPLKTHPNEATEHPAG